MKIRNGKIFKLFLILSCFGMGRSQTTYDEIISNFCEVSEGTDNLSCTSSPARTTGNCYSYEQLCDQNNECTNGEDEFRLGSTLLCPDSSNTLTVPMFQCVFGTNIPVTALCDGVDDCLAVGGPSGDDEDFPGCDNKCLPPYYGACGTTRICSQTRNLQSCGDCLDGYIALDGNQGDCTPVAIFEFEFASYSPNEGDAAIDVCVTLFYPASSVNNIVGNIDVTVELNAPGDASFVGSDTVTFVPGDFMECVTILATDDSSPEGVETFTMTLNIPTGVQFDLGNQGTSTLIIGDNDAAIFQFTDSTFNTNEGTQSLTVNVQLTSNVVLEASTVVTVQSSTLSAVAGTDFDNTPITITFQAGDAIGVTRSGTISITDDPIIENTEDFNLLLVVPAGSQLGSMSTSTGVILDNDELVVAFQFPTYTMLEDAVQTVCLITTSTIAQGVTRTVAVSTETITVTGTGSATAGSDYVVAPAPSTLTFTSTSNTQCTQITLLPDGINEQEEVFGLVATVGNVEVDTAQLFITDIDLVELEFDLNSIDVGESAGNVEVCVNLASGILTSGITVTLTPSGLSATIADDFSATPVTIPFNAGSQPGVQVCGTIGIVPDNLVEGNENFLVTGSSADAQFVNGQNTAIVNIIDDDEAIFQFFQNTFSFSEGISPAVVSVELAPGSGTLISNVQILISTTTGGTATGGNNFNSQTTDFITSSETVTFPAGASPSDAPIPTTTIVVINNDNLVEANIETIIVEAIILGGGGAGTFPNGQAAINIVDDDVLQLDFQMPEYSVLEDMTLMVCLTNTGTTSLATGITVDVNVATSSGAAAPNAGVTAAIPDVDYNPTLDPATLPFTSSSNTFVCTTLTLIIDDTDEPEEVLTITASSTSTDVSIVTPSVPVFITDIDLIIIEFQQMMYNINEGGPSVMICVDLAVGIVGTAGLEITVSNNGGTATLNNDYSPISQVLTFPPGTAAGDPQEDMQCFSLFVTDDQAIENTETIVLIASSDSDVMFTQSNQAIVNIIDNDEIFLNIQSQGGPAGVFSINVPEDIDMVEVCVGLSNTVALERPVVFTLATADGTGMYPAMGTPPSDYQTISLVLTAEAGGETEICTNVNIINDVLNEFDEDIQIVLTSDDPAASIINSPGTITILDDDITEIRAPDTITVLETAGDLVIPLSQVIEKAPGRECVVIATFMDMEAISPNDYEANTQMLTFTSDDSTLQQDVVVPIVDDNICEGDETFQVMLSTTSESCTIAEGDTPILVTITDDELLTNAGDDPHFSIVLPGGKLLCYTVQGEHGFSFNLISNNKMTMNAKFVPDSRRSEVTWMGSMGIVVHDSTYKQSNSTGLRFEAKEKKIYIGDKVALEAKNIEKLTFKNGKLMISEAPPTSGYKRPSVYVDLQDVEIAFTIKYVTEHLDIFWHKTGGKVANSHGIIGQFFRKGVEIDEIRKILMMPNKEPVPIMRRPVWSFMEREDKRDHDDQLCWTAMNAGYQGEGLIDGTYFDYLVDDVMTGEFQMKKF